MTVLAPETVNLSSLPYLPLQRKQFLPKLACCYFVLLGDRVLYIGQTLELRKRWRNHHRLSELKAIEGEVKIAWLCCSDSSLLPAIEDALIQWFQPELNENPLDNLIHEGRPSSKEIYGEDKKKRTLSITETGWRGAKSEGKSRGL